MELRWEIVLGYDVQRVKRNWSFGFGVETWRAIKILGKISRVRFITKNKLDFIQTRSAFHGLVGYRKYCYNAARFLLRFQ